MLTKRHEGKLVFWGARHLGYGGGEPVLESNQSGNVTEAYY